MSRIALPPLVSPQLFRHFAVVTVALTACIGLIADGESREAVREEFAEREARNQVLRTEREKVGERKIDLRRRPERYRWRSADESGPDIPVDGGNYATTGGSAPDETTGYTGFGPPPSYEVMQTTDPWAAQPASGSADPAGNTAAGVPGAQPQPQKKKPFKPTRADIAQTIAAARARSGGYDSDDF